ncbi:hypothetical protein evm_008692 [Chilo suppressalis]|nr:hypothetical protein evm_008692 [Chilo suppressalis]
MDILIKHETSFRSIGNLKNAGSSIVEILIPFENDMKDWAGHCQRLKRSCKLLDSCFKTQERLRTRPYCCQFVVYLRSIDGVTIFIYSVGMIQYFVILLTTVMAGQKLQNSWKALMKSLSILRILFLKNPEIKETKSLRDLVRLVNLEPLRLQLISSLPLDMTLVPVSISLIVSYIIVLLQLNKII